MNSNKVKPENYDHLHLVYHFTITLISQHLTIIRMVFVDVLNFRCISKMKKIQKILWKMTFKKTTNLNPFKQPPHSQNFHPSRA